MTRDLRWRQPEKAGGVVVEDIALLAWREEWRFFDCGNGRFDNAWPDHLVGAEQDPLAVGVDEPPRRPRLAPEVGDPGRDVDAEVRAPLEQSAEGFLEDAKPAALSAW